uniref:Uncharacterized protein n=1 Tax=Arundo donax TaxID=35708 RepID=A0A0A8ZGN3_ARUDO
MAGRSSSAPE